VKAIPATVVFRRTNKRSVIDTCRFVCDVMAVVLFVMEIAAFRLRAPLLARMVPTKALSSH
jgi:hypothetical protein